MRGRSSAQCELDAKAPERPPAALPAAAAAVHSSSRATVVGGALVAHSLGSPHVSLIYFCGSHAWAPDFGRRQL
jgi:hypothetical protein